MKKAIVYLHGILSSLTLITRKQKIISTQWNIEGYWRQAHSTTDTQVSTFLLLILAIYPTAVDAAVAAAAAAADLTGLVWPNLA